MTNRLEQMLSHTQELERPRAEAPSAVAAGAMGGSARAADALAFVLPGKRITVHEDFDLPADAPENALYLAVSYSGETEEAISFARAALARRLPFAAVASGGALAKLAREAGAPLALVPPGMPPRDALFHMLRAALAAVGETEAALSESVISLPDDARLARAAEALAGAIEGKIPVFYASVRNEALARIAKMYCNESGKIPSFAGAVPARAHDELQGFDPSGPHAARGGDYLPVFFRDGSDDPRTVRRIDVMKEMLEQMGMRVHEIALPAAPRGTGLLYSWRLMQEASRLFAGRHGIDPAAAPIIEAFKRKP
ncbi:MAG: SIS domain-containing protein [bacterium]|nr:SIS domain-containing protein [bacterium]